MTVDIVCSKEGVPVKGTPQSAGHDWQSSSAAHIPFPHSGEQSPQSIAQESQFS